MADGTGGAGEYIVELSGSELETVVEALRLLLATLGREDADQIAEIEALLARLPATGA